MIDLDPTDPYYLDNLKAEYASATKNAMNYLKAYHNHQGHHFYVLGVMWEECAKSILAVIEEHEGPKTN